MQTFQFFENTGGMNLRFNDLTLSQGEAEEIINLHATTRGSWSSNNAGYVHLNSTALGGGAAVTALYEYVTLAGLAYLMAVVGTKMYTFEPSLGTSVELTSSLTENRQMHFVTFKWDGINPLANLSGWPPTITGITPGNPSISEIFANRLIFSGDSSNPSLIYLSALENAENFTPTTGATSAGAIQVSPGDGEKITALKTLFLPSSNEEILVIFKENSTYLLTGNDANTFTLQKVSDEFGAVSHLSVVPVGNELIFLSKEGVTSLSTATAQGNITNSFLSDRIRPQIDNLNRSKLSASFAVHLRNRQEVWWFVPDGSATQNQTIMVYNYGVNRAWSKRTGITAASGTTMNGNLYTGTYNGIIQQQLKGNSYNGQAIPWTYRTGFQNFSEPRLRKRIRDIELFLKQISSVNVTVNMYWDFKRSSSNRQSRIMQVIPDSSSSIYNSAVYGQDTYNLSGTSICKFTPAGSGKYFQLELTGEEVNKPVEIEGWSITTINGGYR
jgi:hypothetical protein